MRRATIAAAIGAVALMGTTLGANASAQDRHQSHPGAGRLDHVLRDHAGEPLEVQRDRRPERAVHHQARAPYTMADHYYGVTHPSMPNYIASIAGDNFGIQDDNDQNVVNLDRRNLVDQLEAHHITLGRLHGGPAGRQAGALRAGAADGTQSPLYAKKHNPFVLFDDVKNNPARMAKSRTTAGSSADLDSRHAPQFVWICRTSATTCTAASTTRSPGTRRPRARYGSTKDDANDAALKQKADAFVKQAVRTIKDSKAWTQQSAIVIVTDENDYTGNETDGGWENADGCCDSPSSSKGDPRVSADWPGRHRTAVADPRDHRLRTSPRAGTSTTRRTTTTRC